MRRLILLATLVLTLPVLAGCSAGNKADSLELQVVKAGRDVIAGRGGKKGPIPVIAQSVLDNLNEPLLEVTLERRNQRAYLYVEAVRHAVGPGAPGDPGDIVIWRTGDGVTLAMRGGVLFATKGLGDDIMSARMQVAGNRPGPATGGEKSFDIRTEDNQSRHLTMVCEVSDLGPETITIINSVHATHHIRETCTGGVAAKRAGDGSTRTGQVVNDYWIDARAGLVWQSRQWAGPGAGYLRIRRVSR